MTELVPVLDDEITEEEPLKTISAFVAVVKEKKDISRSLKVINSAYPMPETLGHLKRVKVISSEKALIFVKIREKEDETIITSGDSEIQVVNIPKGPIRTRKQFLETKRIWPCNFHPDKHLEDLLERKDPELWNPEAVTSRIRFFSIADAVVVDPAKNEVVATGMDRRKDHPLRHATIDVIDEISKLPEESKLYLATGFDIYLTNEPCSMCAMALVHMRIRRIFFRHSNPKNGAVKSKFKLQFLSGINHKFQVYHQSIS